MIATLRSELLKQRTTRTNPLLLAWMVGLVLLVVALHLMSLSVAELSRQRSQIRILGLGTSIGPLFAALLGALSITRELRTGTIRPTLLVTPRRTRVLAAKLAASMLAGAGIGLLAEALTAGAEAIGLAARGVHAGLGAGDYAQLLAGGALAGTLFAAIGLGVGTAVRDQVTAVVGLSVWLLFLEPLLLGDAPSVAKYAPEASAGAIAGAIQSQTADTLLAPALGVVLLATYAALGAAAGALLITRRDVD
jgi:ABC-2 type transport system permease protein